MAKSLGKKIIIVTVIYSVGITTFYGVKYLCCILKQKELQDPSHDRELTNLII